jgi:hypothetical protein
MSKRLWAGLALAALTMMVSAPVAAAGPNDVPRPFAARFAGYVHWEFPGEHPSDCGPVTTVTDATGTATHLGEAVWASSHCPAEPERTLDGSLTLVAANGDELNGVYDYDPFDEENLITVFFIGGTGRFGDASGEGVLAYEAIPELVEGCNDPTNFACLDLSVPWRWSATLTGHVTY